MAKLWKNGENGTRKNGKFVPDCLIFPISPISYKFHAFFLHFPLGIFGIFSHFPISPHFPPYFPISPHFPPFPPIFLYFSIFPIFLYLCC